MVSDALSFATLDAGNASAACALIVAGLSERWGHYDARYNPDLQDLLASYRSDDFLVGTLAGNVIATGALRRESAQRGRILRMSVAREQRGTGIGRELLRQLEAQARQRQLQQLVLETTSDWDDARRFYLSCGYRETHTDAQDTHFAKHI